MLVVMICLNGEKIIDPDKTSVINSPQKLELDDHFSSSTVEQKYDKLSVRFKSASDFHHHRLLIPMDP